jgi:Nucleotidyl transferase AbiEii toxin, Type IV TA system
VNPEFKPPRRPPTRKGHLERLVGEYGRAHGLAIDRTRGWLSIVAFAGAMDAAQASDDPRFLIKGGTAMELRLGLGARTTKDVDLVFRGDPRKMLDALEEAFATPYGEFSFRRKGPIEDIRDTGSRRLAMQVEFAGSSWQTLQLEVARPEAEEPELVPVAVSLADFKLNSPSVVACLSLRYQIAQKLHAVTERPEDRENLRFWDLIDLIFLREIQSGDLVSVREACVQTFSTRFTHAWPPELDVPNFWRDPYIVAIEEIDRVLPATVEAAALVVREFIAEIDAAPSR